MRRVRLSATAVLLVHEVRHKLTTPLRMLLETSYKTGTLPREWKVANTVPSKKGNKTELNNYRPVIG